MCRLPSRSWRKRRSPQKSLQMRSFSWRSTPCSENLILKTGRYVTIHLSCLQRDPCFHIGTKRFFCLRRQKNMDETFLLKCNKNWNHQSSAVILFIKTWWGVCSADLRACSVSKVECVGNFRVRFLTALSTSLWCVYSLEKLFSWTGDGACFAAQPVFQSLRYSLSVDAYLWLCVCVFDGCTDTLHRRALMMPESMIIHVSNRCFVCRVVLSKQRKIIQFDGWTLYFLLFQGFGFVAHQAHAARHQVPIRVYWTCFCLVLSAERAFPVSFI